LAVRAYIVSFTRRIYTVGQKCTILILQ